MTAPLDPRELAELGRTFVLGTVRSPARPPGRVLPPSEPWPEVAALAFHAQQACLTKPLPARAAGFRPFERPEDPRHLFPEALRPMLLRLLARMRQSEAASSLRAIPWLLDERGARFHPFDEAAVQSFPFLRAGRQVATLPPHAWTEGAPSMREAWLRAERARDPASARDRLEAGWSGEKAEVRRRLLATLEVGLGPEDRPFLERALSDRSAKVEAEAARLLARFADSPVTEAAIEELASALEVRGAGPGRIARARGRRRSTERLAALIRRVPPRRLAERLGIPPMDLLRLDQSVEGLRPELAAAAAEHGELTLLRTLLDGLGAWSEAGSAWMEALAAQPPGQRAPAVAQLLAGERPSALLADLAVAEDWAHAFERPLPPDASARLRRAPVFRRLLARLEDPDEGAGARRRLARVAPLVHPADAGEAEAQLRASGHPSAEPLADLFGLLHRLHAALSSPPPPEGRDEA